MSEPLTDEQLAGMERVNANCVGLSWRDACRLLAEIKRLRTQDGSVFVEAQLLGYGQGRAAGLEEAAKMAEDDDLPSLADAIRAVKEKS